LIVDNPNRATIHLIALEIPAIEGYHDLSTLHKTVGPLDQGTAEIVLQRYPSPLTDDRLEVAGTLFFEFEDGVVHECEAKGSIVCKQLYIGKRPSLRDRFKP
jgi:hypothetical protein